MFNCKDSYIGKNSNHNLRTDVNAVATGINIAMVQMLEMEIIAASENSVDEDTIPYGIEKTNNGFNINVAEYVQCIFTDYSEELIEQILLNERNPDTQSTIETPNQVELLKTTIESMQTQNKTYLAQEVFREICDGVEEIVKWHPDADRINIIDQKQEERKM